MPRSFLALTLAFAGALAAADQKPVPQSPGAASSAVREISVDEADKLIRARKDVAVIDVRTAPEYAQGHLPRARLVDFLREDFVPALGTLKLDKAKPCVVYCAIGGRAKRAAEKMSQLGFKEILLPKGSFKGWKEAGKEIEGAPEK